MHKWMAGILLGAVLLAAVGCGGGDKDEGVKYRPPNVTIKPLPKPADPGGTPPAPPARGKPAGGSSNPAN